MQGSRGIAAAMFVVMVLVPGLVAAEDVSIVIEKQIREIAKIASDPKAADADKSKMQELYKSVQAQGLNAAPVFEEVLKSKGHAAEKQVSLYLAGLMFAPRTVEETATRGQMLIKYIKLGLADESEQVRGYALQMLGGMTGGVSYGEAYYLFRDHYKTETNTQLRVYALSRIAGFMIDEAYRVITDATNDPDPQVRQAAVAYKAHQDQLRATQAEQAAAAGPAKAPSERKGSGKNAHI